MGRMFFIYPSLFGPLQGILSVMVHALSWCGMELGSIKESITFFKKTKHYFIQKFVFRNKVFTEKLNTYYFISLNIYTFLLKSNWCESHILNSGLILYLISLKALTE